MKKYLLELLSVLLAIVLLPSCSKDFDSNAPYADVTIVYGVLDADQSTNYIKIYRGFLTEGDAYQAATIYDSLYYFDKIKVELEEYVANRLTHTWELDTTTQIPREDGDFTTKQLLYVVPQPINESATYKLVITNKETRGAGHYEHRGAFRIEPSSRFPVELYNDYLCPVKILTSRQRCFLSGLSGVPLH